MDIVIYEKGIDGYCAAWLLARNLDIPYSHCVADDGNTVCMDNVKRIYLAGIDRPIGLFACEDATVYRIKSDTSLEIPTNCTLRESHRALCVQVYQDLNVTCDVERRITNYVEDHVFGSNRLGYTREVVAYFGLTLDFQRWNCLAQETDATWREKGTLLTAQLESQMAGTPFRYFTWLSTACVVANAVHNKEELGRRLLTSNVERALVYHDSGVGCEHVCVCRSVSDAAGVATAYGGHSVRNIAYFVTSKEFYV